MNFINQIKNNAIPIIKSNYQAILIMIALIISIFNITRSYFVSKYEKTCQKQLNKFGRLINQVNFGNIIIFILLSIFVFDFIYNKKYILEIPVKPEFKISYSILGL